MSDGLRALVVFAACAALAGAGAYAASHGVRPAAAAILVIVAMIGVGAFLKSTEETRRERRARGQCARCGYDLTGNVSGVCPECGTRKG